jgi:hypothetical protein
MENIRCLRRLVCCLKPVASTKDTILLSKFGEEGNLIVVVLRMIVLLQTLCCLDQINELKAEVDLIVSINDLKIRKTIPYKNLS